jgi:hypothetical protein
VADYLTESAKRLNIKIVPFSAADVDAVAFLCGCPRACVARPETKPEAKHHLVVAGESLDGKPVPAEELPKAIEKALARLIQANL